MFDNSTFSRASIIAGVVAFVIGLGIISVVVDVSTDVPDNVVGYGYVAVRPISFGVFSLGAVSVGLVSVGFVSIGFLSIGVFSLGVINLAVVGIAAAGIAVHGMYATEGGGTLALSIRQVSDAIVKKIIADRITSVGQNA